MTRVIQLCLVVLALVSASSEALADKKKIAILEVEAVVGANGKIDPEDTKFAKSLTTALRERANNSGVLDLITEKRALVDEKLMNNCGSEDAKCMAPIGASMQADVLLFGKVANAGNGWKVSLKVVNVKKKEQTASDPNVQISKDTAGASDKLGGWVRDRWRTLTGEGSDGTVLIRPQGGATSGSVYVDGELKDTLKSGTATLTLPEKRYKIGIEADGFKLWEQRDVTVSAEKPVTLSPTLEKKKEPDKEIKVVPDPDPNKDETVTGTESITKEGTVSTKKSKTLFKVGAAVGLGGAAIAGGIWLYSWTKTKAYNDASVPAGTVFEVNSMQRSGTVDYGDCGKGGVFKSGGSDNQSLTSTYNTACDWRGRQPILVGATIGLAVIGGGALIYLMASKDDAETRPAGASVSKRKKQKKNFLVTPVVTPDGATTTLRFDW
jgi:hypothetical protein